MLIKETETQREDDMTTDTHYILSLTLDKGHPPIVVDVPRDYESVKSFVLEYNAKHATLQGDNPIDILMQRSILSGLIVGILQCVDRAGDTHIVEQLKEDDQTKHLFIEKENNDKQHSGKNGFISERSEFTDDFERMFQGDKTTKEGTGGDEMNEDYSDKKVLGNAIKRQMNKE